MRRDVISVCACIVVIVGLAGDARAHRPIFSDGTARDAGHAISIDDVSISQVVYHEVTEDAAQVWLTFEAEQGQSLYVQIGVPVIEGLEDFRPAVAVLGPGLDEVELPFEILHGLTGRIFTTDAVTEPESFYEPFTGTDSWILREEEFDLPAAGRYYVVGYVPSGETGKLWVSVGRREVFGAADLVRFPAWRKQARAFHEVDGVPGAGLLCPLLGTGLALALFAVPLRRRRWGRAVGTRLRRR